MARARLTLYWSDENGRKFTNSLHADDALFGASDVDLIAALQDLQDMSSCNLDKVEVAREIPGSSFTGSQPLTTGAYRSASHKAVLQFTKRAASGVVQVSIPGPVEGLFMGSGAYEGVDVDPADALVVALEATWTDFDLLMTPEGGLVDFQKGWLSGHKHS